MVAIPTARLYRLCLHEGHRVTQAWRGSGGCSGDRASFHEATAEDERFGGWCFEPVIGVSHAAGLDVFGPRCFMDNRGWHQTAKSLELGPLRVDSFLRCRSGDAPHRFLLLCRYPSSGSRDRYQLRLLREDRGAPFRHAGCEEQPRAATTENRSRQLALGSPRKRRAEQLHATPRESLARCRDGS